MSDGGNDVVEERRKKRGDEESPRLNIRRYDNFSRQNPCSFLSRSPALASTNQISCCFFLYADLLRIVRQSSGTIAPHSNHCKVFRDNQKAPITPHIDITNAPSLGHLTHTCSSPRGKPPATNYPLLQLISLYIRRDATFIFLLPCFAMQFFSPSYTVYALPPQYTLYATYFFSGYIYTPLQKRHHSPHNPQQPHTHLHTPRSVLPRRTRRIARPRACGTRCSAARRACACLRPTRTRRRHRALSSRNYCNRTRRSDGGTGA